MSSVATVRPDATTAPDHTNRWTSGPALVAYIALVELTVLLLVAPRYGYLVDELYFLGSSNHMAWGYIDHPPMVVALAYLGWHILGGSLIALRLAPALFATALVLVTGALTRNLGGNRFAQLLSAVAVLAAPGYLMIHHQLSTDAFQPLAWTSITLVALLAVQRAQANYWLLCGLIMGVALEDKYTVGLFVVALTIGLVLTKPKQSVLTTKFWIGALIAFLLFLPHFMWEVHRNFPFMQWQAAIRENHAVQRFDFNILHFFSTQALQTLPAVPLCLLAFWFFLREKQFRFIGITLIAALILLLKFGGKGHYAIPLYAIAFAGGAVAFEHLTENLRWLRPASIAIVLALGAILAPCFVPILPVEKVPAYQRSLHLPLPIREEPFEESSELAPTMAGEFGWEEIAQATAKVYWSLPEEERKKTGILAQTYGPAGAIDFWGKKYGLPGAISPQLSYHDFGPRNYTSDIIIWVGVPPENLTYPCTSVTPGAVVQNPYGYAAFRGPIVNICRGVRFDIQRDWPGFQHY